MTGRKSSSSFFRYNWWTLLQCSRNNFRLLDLSVQCLQCSPSKTGRISCGLPLSGGNGIVLCVYGCGKSATYASTCRRSSSFVLWILKRCSLNAFGSTAFRHSLFRQMSTRYSVLSETRCSRLAGRGLAGLLELQDTVVVVLRVTRGISIGV